MIARWIRPSGRVCGLLTAGVARIRTRRMRVQLPLLARSLTGLRLGSHPGQLIVIAFSNALQLQESPVLERIRAELRGLGAALFLISETRVFAFRPDDELDLFGTTSELGPSALGELRA